MQKTLASFLILAIAAVSFLTPLSVSLHNNTLALVPQEVHAQEDGSASGIFICNPGPGEGSFLECIPEAVYLLLVTPTGFLAALAGRILDFFLFYSISSSSYSDFAFIEEGWGVVRDIANIFFIFALLMIAIGMILNLGSIKAKKLLVNVIVVALLINFSLFFTRVIVDASNILTRVFYNRVEVQNDDSFFSNITAGIGNPKSVTYAIMSKIQPQKLFDRETFSAEVDGVPINDTSRLMMFGMLVFIIMIAFHLMLIYIFLSVAFLFLTRVITLWMTMIFAPFAFITLVIPKGKGMKQFGFRAWSQTLVKVSFMAPIFVFFLFLILKFLESDFISINASDGFFEIIIGTTIPFLILIGLLWAAKKAATEFSGELGKATIGAVEGLAKTASVGLATGGASLATAGASAAAASAGRNTAGRAGEKLSQWGQTLKNKKGAGVVSRLGGKVLKATGDAAASSSFDWRATKRGQAITRKMGPLAGIGVKTGGIKQQRQDYEEKIKKQADGSQLTDNEKITQDLHGATAAFQSFVDDHKQKIGELDKDIEKARQEHKDAGSPTSGPEFNKLKAAKARKKAWEDKEQPVMDANGQPKKDKNGNFVKASFTDLENKKDTAQASFDNENHRRRKAVIDRSAKSNVGEAALGGTAVGAAAGSLIPGIGTAIGAIVGGTLSAGFAQLSHSINASNKANVANKLLAGMTKTSAKQRDNDNTNARLNRENRNENTAKLKEEKSDK